MYLLKSGENGKDKGKIPECIQRIYDSCFFVACFTVVRRIPVSNIKNIKRSTITKYKVRLCTTDIYHNSLVSPYSQNITDVNKLLASCEKKKGNENNFSNIYE